MLGANGDHGLLKLRVQTGHAERGQTCIGAHEYDGRIGQELHDHAHVLVVLREHHGRDGHGRAARRMRLGQELRRRLTKVLDLGLHGLLGDGIVDALQANGALVGQIIEDVAVADGLGSALLVAEYEIDPLVDLTRDELGLERQAVDAHKVMRVFRPFGQLDVVDHVFVLCD